MASNIYIPNVARDVLLQEAIENAKLQQSKQKKIIEDQIKDAQSKLNKLSNNLWHIRPKQDLKNLITDLQEKLDSTMLSIDEMKIKVSSIEQRYSKALLSTSTKYISSSLHSASDAKKRPAVLITHLDEFLRQKLRAELGLQDAPMLLTTGDICDLCGIQMVIVSNDSMLSCTRCHKLRVLPNSTSASQGLDIDSNSTITKHRLPECIELAQGKEFGEPPDEIVEAIARYFISTKFIDLSDHIELIKTKRPFLNIHDAETKLNMDLSCLRTITSQKVRVAIKALVNAGHDECKTYIDKSVKIAAYISGYWPPRMNAQQEEQLRMLYTKAAPFYERKKKLKQAFWPGGFPYFLRAITILLGWDEFAPLFHIPLTSKAARETLREEIWHELAWEFVPISGTLPNIIVDGVPVTTVLHDEKEEAGMFEDENLQIKTPKKRRRDVKFLTC